MILNTHLLYFFENDGFKKVDGVAIDFLDCYHFPLKTVQVEFEV